MKGMEGGLREQRVFLNRIDLRTYVDRFLLYYFMILDAFDRRKNPITEGILLPFLPRHSLLNTVL